jgi:tetratricopeptide (TPR) repeat protein
MLSIPAMAAASPAIRLGCGLLLLSALACGENELAKHLAKGTQLQGEGQYEEAQLEGLYVLLRDPENESALHLVATSLLEQDRDGEAEAYFRTLAALNLGRSLQAGELYAEKAQLDYENGERSRARRRWRAALSFHPNLDLGPYSFFMAGHEYSDGNWVLASQLFGRALDAFPDSTAVRSALYPYGVSLHRLERWSEAMNVLDIYLRSYPRHGRRHEAIWLYQEILIHEAKAYRIRLDYDGCIELLRKALRFKDNPTKTGEALLELGVCYEDMQDYIAAGDAYRRVVDLNPSGTGRIYDSALQRLETLEKARLK